MKTHLAAALCIVAIILVAAPNAVNAQKDGKFWISYDGAGLKVDRFSYKDDKGERDLPGVTIVKAEGGAGYTIVGRTWKIKNLLPEKDGKLLVGTFEQGPIRNRILYWRE
jgi:hypothetical protein